MAIISPQRNAIASLGLHHEALERESGQTIPDSLGEAGPLNLLGVSQGMNFARPYVLVCGEADRPDTSSQHIDVGACDYAVLLRNPTDSERHRVIDIDKDLGGAALRTLELLRTIKLPGRTALIRTGIVETYPVI